MARALGVEQGQEMDWDDLRARVRERVAPDDLAALCEGCPWLPYGVCAEGISELHAGLPLRGASGDDRSPANPPPGR